MNNTNPLDELLYKIATQSKTYDLYNTEINVLNDYAIDVNGVIVIGRNDSNNSASLVSRITTDFLRKLESCGYGKMTKYINESLSISGSATKFSKNILNLNINDIGSTMPSYNVLFNMIPLVNHDFDYCKPSQEQLKDIFFRYKNVMCFNQHTINGLMKFIGSTSKLNYVPYPYDLSVCRSKTDMGNALKAKPTSFYKDKLKKEFGIAKRDAFVAITEVDFSNSLTRSNLISVIDAFAKTFYNTGDAYLVVKIQANAESKINDTLFKIIKAYIEQKYRTFATQHIKIFPVSITHNDYKSMIAGADAFISVPYANTIPVSMYDAFAMNVPVIATEYGCHNELFDCDGCYYKVKTSSSNIGVNGGVAIINGDINWNRRFAHVTSVNVPIVDELCKAMYKLYDTYKKEMTVKPSKSEIVEMVSCVESKLIEKFSDDYFAESLKNMINSINML